MSDQDRIDEAIDEAQATGQPISHAAARMIAAAYHGGQATAGYSFASTGVIHDSDELLRDLFTGIDHDASREKDALRHYLTDREQRGETDPVEGWSRLWLE
ncbi:hypothetical protein [Actinopolyspora erythraea]|uniref:hypothetical protein n=1 Tax=Actinopolyspora erythraea TaxID=414996 RepID=UPI000693595E|nr:hypothetical protein [Actinopolyspora erythraea]